MIGSVRWRFRSVGSTQDVAFRLAAMGANHGTIVRADYQTAGRGRLGRSWEVPANTAIMFSMLLRPVVPLHELGTLSICVAATLAEVFEAAGATGTAIKWPNDVLIRGRKVSGILVQTRMMPEPVAIVGIGINLDTPPASLPPTATSLAQEIGKALPSDAFFDDVVAALDLLWSAWRPILSPAQVDALDGKLWLRGEEVTLLDADRTISGSILGLALDGGLRLQINGVERIVRTGEITRGPRPSGSPLPS